MGENILHVLTEWKEWEGILHIISYTLLAYIIYNDKKYTVINLLLLLIALSIGILIHQGITIKKTIMCWR